MSRKATLLHLLTLAFVLAVVNPLAALDTQEENENLRRTIVTFDGKFEALPELTPEDFELRVGKKKITPSRIYAPGDLPTLLAIVMQENQKAEFEGQLSALREFILRQTENTFVGVFYFKSDDIDSPGQFDSNLERVVGNLRAPRGTVTETPRAYYSGLAQLVEFMRNLPVARKEILLFTDGSDPGARGASARQNQGLSKVIEVAGQSGIPLWAIYSEVEGAKKKRRRGPGRDELPSITPVGGSQGRGGVSHTANTNPYENTGGTGKSYLKRLAKETGGKVFSAKKFAKDIKPLLEDFAKLLDRQYVLEFESDESIQNEAVKQVKLKKKIKGAKLIYPKW